MQAFLFNMVSPPPPTHKHSVEVVPRCQPFFPPAQGKVLVIGGYQPSSRNYRDKLDMWDPETRSWSQPTPQGEAWPGLAWHSAVLFPPNKLLLYGGEKKGAVHNTLQQLTLGGENAEVKLGIVTWSVCYQQMTDDKVRSPILLHPMPRKTPSTTVPVLWRMECTMTGTHAEKTGTRCQNALWRLGPLGER